MNVKLTDITNANMRLQVKFAKLNKNDTVAEYQQEIAKGEYRVEDCKVTHTAILSNEDYDIFANTLLTDYAWLAGMGGSVADMEVEPTGSFYEWTEAQREEFRRNSYRLVVAVIAPKRRTLYVDPQGYQYARYVGLMS